MKRPLGIVAAITAWTALGCATIPPGPSVLVMPGSAKSFEAFQADDAVCRQWAESRSGWRANETVNENLAAGAVAGGALGAAAGALIGAASGNAAAGAAIGAGAGLLAGSAMAHDRAFGSGWEVQRRYDQAYQQCMYAKGNQVPAVADRPAPRASRLPPPPPYRPGAAGPPPPPPYPEASSRVY